MVLIQPPNMDKERKREQRACLPHRHVSCSSIGILSVFHCRVRSLLVSCCAKILSGSMESDLDDGRRTRRQPRRIVFFDHVEPSLWNRKMPGAERMSGWFEHCINLDWKKYLRIVRFLLQATVLWFAVVTLGGLLLRGIGTFCKYTPLTPSICAHQWITSQEPALDSYSSGKTPTTKALEELSRLNDISPSLQTLGLIMSLVSANLSTTYTDLYAFSETFQLSREDLENLALATRHTQGMVEQFSDEEYYYRQSSLLWNHNGINVLGVGMDGIREVLNDTSRVGLAVMEQAMHRLPYAARWSLSRSVLKEYFYFVGEQQVAVKELVIQATETDFVLGDLLGLFGQLERTLQHVVEERGRVCGSEVSDEKGKICALDQSPPLRAATNMRAAVQWCQDAVKAAEAHYKNLLSELSRTTEALRRDMRGYRSVWPSKGVLSLHRLDSTLSTERRQLDSYVETAERAEEVMASFGHEFLGDEEGFALPRQLMEAIAKRELQWW